MAVVCSGSCLKAAEISNKLIAALIQHESRGDDMARGDLNLKDKAYGCLQIRQPAMTDALGASHRAEECLGNRKLSIEVLKKYLARYATTKRLGHEPTDEDKARIWNGGPTGWQKESTKKYWKEVKKLL